MLDREGQSPRWHDPALLDHLRRVREPWDQLTQRIVQAVLTKFLPEPTGPLVEIGAGGGQLRDWLPKNIASETVHTEPSEPFLESLRNRFPDAKTARADATNLPFDPESVTVVLGLCVFDTVPDLASVRDELHRILRPGGVLVHFLDLSTNPDCLFPELIARGEIPLTNFARDPALLSVLSAEKKALLPAADDFDEVIAVGWEPFTRFVGMLEQANHPLAADLGPYRQLDRAGRLDSALLAREFMVASADSTKLFALNKSLLALTLYARQLGREWPLRAVSSRAHIRDRLRKAFGLEKDFTVELAGPVAAREVVPDRAAESRFVLRHAGRTINRSEIAPELHGTAVEALDGTDSLPGREPTAGEMVRETTVEVFVAHRL